MDMFTSLEDADPGGPFVIGQLGQSLDGRIATVSGDARDIGGPAGLRHLHALRARVDAVVVGASTVLADNPRLTVRLVEGRSPARVVIDPRGRLDDQGQWLAQDGVRRILITASDDPGAKGAEIIRLPELEGGGFAPERIVAALAEAGLAQAVRTYARLPQSNRTSPPSSGNIRVRGRSASDSFNMSGNSIAAFPEPMMRGDTTICNRSRAEKFCSIAVCAGGHDE
mgnify:CR=1 FL=1